MRRDLAVQARLADAVARPVGPPEDSHRGVVRGWAGARPHGHPDPPARRRGTRVAHADRLHVSGPGRARRTAQLASHDEPSGRVIASGHDEAEAQTHTQAEPDHEALTSATVAEQ